MWRNAPVPAVHRIKLFSFAVLGAALAVGFGSAGRLTPASLRTQTAAHGVATTSTAAVTAPNTLSAEQAWQRIHAEQDAYYVSARREVDRSVAEMLEQRRADLDRGLKYTKFFHGHRTKREIALTFDDGPHPAYTPEILKILKQENVPATFFLVGEQAEQHPELVRAEIEGGHTVANHTYHHVSLPRIPQMDVANEIKACGDVLRAETGRAPRFFRPPGGEYNRQVAEAAKALGYTMVLWTDDPGDYASPGKDVILQRTLDKAAPGGIILIHDGIQQTVDVLPRLIQSLKAQGYSFVTIDEMLNENRVVAPARKFVEEAQPHKKPHPQQDV